MKKAIVIVGGILAVFLILCLGIIATVSATKSVTSDPSTGPVTIEPTIVQPTESVPVDDQSAADAAKPKGIGEGEWLVGTDVPAGRYRTTGGDACYWAREKSTSGELNDIIANNIAKGPQYVTLKAGEYFKTDGCAPWTKA